MANIALQDGKVVLKNGNVSCTCCGGIVTGYTICIDNTNQILDNSWNVSINYNYIAYYDGSAFFNQCFNIPINYLNISGSNRLDFSLANCQSDDFFEFYILDVDGNQVYSGNSGFLNGSYFIDGICTDNHFERIFFL